MGVEEEGGREAKTMEEESSSQQDASPSLERRGGVLN